MAGSGTHAEQRHEYMTQLGKVLPADIIRDLGAMFDNVELCCVLDAFMEAENSEQLRSVRRQYHTEALARARAILDLSSKGTLKFGTYAEMLIEGALPAVEPWEMEAASAELSRMRERDPGMELEWSWDMLRFDDNWWDWDL